MSKVLMLTISLDKSLMGRLDAYVRYKHADAILTPRWGMRSKVVRDILSAHLRREKFGKGDSRLIGLKRGEH